MINGNRCIQTLIVLLALPVLLGSCVLFQSNATYYYLFEYDTPEQEPVGGSHTDIDREEVKRGTVVVEEAIVSPIYERRQIVQRTEGPQLTFLSNDLWAVNPSRGLQELVFQNLREASLFDVVEAPGRQVEATYRLVSTIDRLEFDIREDTPKALVSIRLSLKDSRTGDDLVTVGGNRTRELQQSTAYFFAVAVNDILREEIDALVAELMTWSPE